jgi:putative endonuclease
LQKRSKKLFSVCVTCERLPQPSEQKFFVSFFQKRNAFSLMTNTATGLAAEATACAALIADGFAILGRRMRTKAGEIDIVAERAGLLVFVEVKRRSSLARAAHALGPRQQARLMAAGEILLGENPGWGIAGTRFDVLLVDGEGRVRRIIDALRQT